MIDNMKENDKMIIYGGAFNPPTLAHKEIGKYLINKYPTKKLVYLPTNSFYNKNDLVSFKDRLKMTKLLVKDLGKSVKVSAYEGRAHKFNGTYHTLIHFKHPYFVIGADALQNLSKWIQAEKLISENKFIVVPRSGFNVEEIMKQDILTKFRDHFIIEKELKESNISSTAYRNEKKDELLTEEVKDYIEKKGLYR